MVNWQQGNDTAALLIDLSPAINSAGALQILEEFLKQFSNQDLTGLVLDLNAGDLLLTRGVMIKIKQQITLVGAHLGIIYATLPQTQQAALSEGLYVKEKPGSSSHTRIRQSLPSSMPGALRMATIGSTMQNMGQNTSQRSIPSSPSGSRLYATRPEHGVDLPTFPTSASAPSYSPASDNYRQPDFRPIEFRASESIPAQMNAAAPVLTETSTSTVNGQSASASDAADSLFTTLDVSASEVAEPFLGIADPFAGELQEVAYSESALHTLYWRQNLRSGQTVRFQGNIVIVGDVHAGSEVTAGGDIMVWGELRGIAHAGAQGSSKAEIRAMRIEALQLRIADYIARRPDRIYYHRDGSDMVVSPELARVSDGEIKIFKTRPGRT